MDMNENKEIFFNRAELEDAERMYCDECFEQVVFLLRDKEHEFSIGLTTVLQCITFAIQNGHLSKIPQSWLADADIVCGTHYADDESNCYPDNNFPRKRE